MNTESIYIVIGGAQPVYNTHTLRNDSSKKQIKMRTVVFCLLHNVFRWEHSGGYEYICAVGGGQVYAYWIDQLCIPQTSDENAFEESMLGLVVILWHCFLLITQNEHFTFSHFSVHGN